MLKPMAMRKNKKAQFTVKSPTSVNTKFSMSERMEFGVTESSFLRNMVHRGNDLRGGPSEGMSALARFPTKSEQAGEAGATEERRNEESQVDGGSGSCSRFGCMAGAGAGGGEERAAETCAGTIGSGARTME